MRDLSAYRRRLHVAARIACAAYGLLLLAVTSGCASDQKAQRFELPGNTRMRVESFDIHGNEVFGDSEIKDGLVTVEDPGWRASVPWLPLLGAEHQYFNYIEWSRDLQRIETFYAARGYFNARVVSESIVERAEEGIVRVSVTVSEGEPVMVESIVIDGLRETPLTEGQVREELPLKTGQTFVQQDYLRAKATIFQLLHSQSYAYATVRGRVVVDPVSNIARVYFFTDPGPASEFGEVIIQGLDRIEEEAVRESVTIEAGDTYDPAALQQAQEVIYDLGVFSLVKVTGRRGGEDIIKVGQSGGVASGDDGTEITVLGPGPSPGGDEEGAQSVEEGEVLGITDILNQAQEQAEVRTTINPVVPVVITLKEAQLWNVRVGTGVASEIARQDVHARFDWTSRNFLGGMRRLEHFNTVGYAWAPAFYSSAQERTEGWILLSRLRFIQPQFIERLLELRLGLEFERGVRLGYTFLSPKARVGLRRRFLRRLIADVSYNFEYYELSNIQSALLQPGARLQQEYTLEYFEQHLLLDLVDDLLNPTSGFVADLTLQEAGTYIEPISPISGDFDYLKVIVGADAYIPFELLSREVLALSGRVGSIYDIGEPNDPPIQERLFAGGAGSIRSFGINRLSFYVADNESAVPIGAFSKLEGSVEPRFRLIRQWLDVGDLWLALFLDAASVQDAPLWWNSAEDVDIDATQRDRDAIGLSGLTSTMLYGVGAGLYLVSPIGPVRVDFAYTLSNFRNDPRFRQCAGGEEICNVEDFTPLDRDVIQGSLDRYNILIQLGHTF